MNEFMPYIWIVVAIAAAVIEALTTSIVSMWFIPSGIVAAILALCNAPIYVQIIVFLCVAILLIVLQRTVFKNFFRPVDRRTNLDTIIGERGIVTERIDNISGQGQIKVKGLYWAARSVNGDNFEVGDVLSVVAIEGVKLICKK